MPNKIKSNVWCHFIKKNKDEAQCVACSKILRCAGGSTSSLSYHLKVVHGEGGSDSSEVFKKRSEIKRQKTLHKCIKKRSIEEDVTKLASVDGFTFNQIANSSFIQESFTKFNYDAAPPTDVASVRNMVLKYAAEKKDNLHSYFKNQVNLGERYSLTLDEYTLQNGRYININVHGKTKHWSLGLIKLSGSINSTKISEMVSKKLGEFGLDLNRHIVGCTTDGASVMENFGKEITPFHQQCIAHTIYLAVCDVMYSKSSEVKVEESNEEIDVTEETDNEYEDLELSNNILVFEDKGEHESALELNKNIRTVIEKVRNICKTFRKSRLKNDKLQYFIKGEYGKEMGLVIDCKTRWNSLLAMVERFLKLRKCIEKALRVVECTEALTEVEWNILQNLMNNLRPVEIILKNLCSEGINLLIAESSIQFLLAKLKSNKDFIGIQLHQGILERYTSRRQNDAVALTSFLHNPILLKNDHFLECSEINIKRCGKKTFERLYKESQDYLNEKKIESNELAQVDDPDQSEHEEALFLKEYFNIMNNLIVKESSENANIMNELKNYEITLTRSENVNKLYNCMLTVKATCIQADRAFSAPGLFITKLRGNLSEKTVDSLYFLRDYFKHKD